MTSFWLAVVAKLASSAAIVVVASMLVERAGPVLGGLVATLPVSAGPAYVFLALDHGPDFLAQSTLASLTANAGTALFIFVYAVLARRRGLLVSLGAALGVWFALAAPLSLVAPNFLQSALLNVICWGGAFLLSRPYRRVAHAVRAPSRWWDLPARAATVVAVVAAVLLAGHWLGPRAAGIAALMPVVMTSLTLILHPRVGGPATASVLTNSIPGMIGFTTGLATLHLTVIPLGSAAALLLALAVCVCWNAALLALNLRLRSPARRR